MRKSRFTTEQIVGILREHEAGEKTGELIRRHGIGTNDWDTAEYLSKMTGDATIHVASENRSTGVSRGRHSQRQHGTAWSRSETGRRLLFPDEVRRLSLERQLLFVKGTEPLLVDRLNYLTDASFAERADANPLYAPVAT